jgi:MYXO-CTERM domain-containing protein
MTVACTFEGSYYDLAPWAEHACEVEPAVPEGCPVHFVIAEVDLANIQVSLLSGGTTTQVASTASLVGTDPHSFLLPDEFSCDCAPTATTIIFQQIAVMIPSAVEGDTVEVEGLDFQITAPAACPPPSWPTDYEVGLACDRCPMNTSGGGLGGGCTAAGGAPPLALAALALLPFLRRRRRGLAGAAATG